MQAQLERLRQRYDFTSWSEPAGPSSIVAGFRLTGDELPGWRPHRIQLVELPGDPPASLSVWRPSEGNGALLAVNVYECDDEAAARRYLLRLLGEFQGPDLQRVATPGEVAFAAGSAGLLFVRNNLVALVRSIERTPAPVAESAQRLDRVLEADGDSPGGEGPDLRSISAPEIDGAPGTAIPIDVPEISAGSAWFRFRTATGTLSLRNRRPVFTPATGGPHEIAVTAIGAAGVSNRTLHIGSPPAGE